MVTILTGQEFMREIYKFIILRNILTVLLLHERHFGHRLICYSKNMALGLIEKYRHQNIVTICCVANKSLLCVFYDI